MFNLYATAKLWHLFCYFMSYIVDNNDSEFIYLLLLIFNV